MGDDERGSGLETSRQTGRCAVRQAGRKRDWSEELHGAVCSELQVRRLGVWSVVGSACNVLRTCQLRQ